MATRFTPINPSEKSAVIRHVPFGSQQVPPDSPPMSPLSPPPSWFNDEDMECPHTPILTQLSSPLASLTSSLPVRLESSHAERSSHSPLLVGQALAPSTILLPKLSALALQQNARPASRKRGAEELETAEVERGKKAAGREAQKTRRTQKTFTQDEETGLLTPVSNVSESTQSSSTRKTVRAGKPEM